MSTRGQCFSHISIPITPAAFLHWIHRPTSFSANAKPAFWHERLANHFSGKSRFLSLDFSAAPRMAPLGPSIDLCGDGSLWANSVPGHTDDDMALLVNASQPVLLTGDASHFEWAFKAGVAPRGWNQAGTARGYQSLVLLRDFAKAYPSIKLVYGHERGAF